MSETVQIALIVAGVVLLALLLFRKNLARLSLRSKGFETELETHPPTGETSAEGSDPEKPALSTPARRTKAKGAKENWQVGEENRIRSRKGGAAESNRQVGKGNEIDLS